MQYVETNDEENIQNLKIHKLFSKKKKIRQGKKNIKIIHAQLWQIVQISPNVRVKHRRHFCLSSPFLGKVIQIIFSQKSFPSFCVITSTKITIFTIFKFSSWQVSEQISEHSSHNSFQPAGLCLRVEVIFHLANIAKAPKTRGEKKSVVLFKKRLFCLI